MAEVEEEFVRFFKQTLGSPKDVIPIDASIVWSGRCLDEAAWSSLLTPVTYEEIKDSLFCIGNDKAPGPDGFSFLFFKKSWVVLGDDFCHAIRDFFV